MNPNQSQFRAAMATAYADLFANDADYAFSASKSSPEVLADKMLAALLAGTGSHTGKGIQRAAKACGIAGTDKAIRAFLGCVDAPKPAKPTPRARKVLVIGLSNIEAMMSGVSRIHRAHNLVTLHYVDGKTESALIPSAKWAEISEKPFDIVSHVQSRRVPSNS